MYEKYLKSKVAKAFGLDIEPIDAERRRKVHRCAKATYLLSLFFVPISLTLAVHDVLLIINSFK